MMRYLMHLLFFISFSALSQFGPQQIITTEAINVELAILSDLDSDGDLDVVSTSRGNNTIAWQENLDGVGTFGSQKVIGILNSSPTYVYAADIDNDGDSDVFVIEQFAGRILWYENVDGLGNFSITNIVATNLNLPKEIVAADLDLDGDLDIISASRDDDTVAWFENLDGLGTFSPKKIISDTALSTLSVYAADLDGDGDQDVMATSAGDLRLYWYENNGTGNFSMGNIITETPGPGGGLHSIFSADIDGDNDMDVLSAEFGGGTISWYENIDGLGTFGPKNDISTTLETPYMVFSIDLDADGDNDVLTASTGTVDEVVWFENINGLGSFSDQKVISTLDNNARSIYAGDIDGDGDNDVLATSIVDYTIAWYENLAILGVEDQIQDNITLFPNPATTSITIHSLYQPVTAVTMYDISGKEIDVPYNNNKFTITTLVNGVYFIKGLLGDTPFIQRFIKL